MAHLFSVDLNLGLLENVILKVNKIKTKVEVNKWLSNNSHLTKNELSVNVFFFSFFFYRGMHAMHDGFNHVIDFGACPAN